jgi:phenylalanyl-tRNA synthetase beta chain
VAQLLKDSLAILSEKLTNPENLFVNMNRKPAKVVDISNPKMLTFTCLRNWLLPSLMEFLSHNTHVEYPQRIFEVGYAVVFDARKETQTRNVQKLVGVITHSTANFTEAKSVLDALFLNLGVQYGIKEGKHNSFIEGRLGKILVNSREVGLLGELHPKVLEAWNLENPAAGFEINLNKIFGM